MLKSLAIRIEAGFSTPFLRSHTLGFQKNSEGLSTKSAVNHSVLFVVCLALVTWVCSDSVCRAQADSLFFEPVPLGTPGVSIGPIANPYVIPPVSIGPAPPFSPLDPDYFPGPRFRSPRYGSPAGHQGIPYAIGQPTRYFGAFPEAGVAGRIGIDALRGVTVVQKPVESPPAIGNLRFKVSEGFLNRFVSRDENTPGEVRDFILGAEVTGRQNTITRLRFDLLPGADKARGMLVLNGTTQSETTGVTPQAKVDVASRQEFVALKELFFDGTSISTRHAVIRVQANSQTLGATTPLTGTLFGGIANKIAFREAERHRPAAEAISRERVVDRVYPEFDNSIDRQLATANDQLELVVRSQLKAMNLMPTRQQVTSTDTSLNYSALVAPASAIVSEPMAGMDLNPDANRGFHVAFHESLLNTIIQRSGLSGYKTTDRKLKELIASCEVTSSDESSDRDPPPIALPGFENIITDIEFDKSEPLAIRIEQDEAFLTLRAKFKPAGQDIVPAISITIPYRTEMTATRILVTPGTPQVTLQDSSTGGAGTDIALKMVAQGIESKLSKLAFDRELPTSVWSVSGPVPRVTEIRLRDGWASISVD